MSEYVKGASASLKKTIKEIQTFLDQDEKIPNKELRVFLDRKLRDLGIKWYKKGFNRGHIQSYKEFKESKKVPKILKYETKRNFFGNTKKKTILKSKIKRS